MLAAGAQLGHVRLQRLPVGGVQLEQAQPVVHGGAPGLGHQRMHQQRRAGIHPPGAPGRRGAVEAGDQLQVVLQDGCFVIDS